jgi:hypothetical protein
VLAAAAGLVLASTLTCGAGVAMAGPPSVTTTHDTIKIHPQDTPPANTSATLSAAGNEIVAFQVVVNGGDGGVSAVTAAASDLSGPATIKANNVRLYREAFINVQTPSDADGSPGAWPDALIPAVDEIDNQPRAAFPFNVPPGQNGTIWVDLYVPQSTPPGSYSGAISVTGSSLGTINVPVALTVQPFSIPSTSSLPTSFGLTWDAPCTQEQGGYAGCQDAGIVASHIRYATLALNHRITLDTVYTGPPQAADGTYDWSSWDQSYGPLLDGTAATIQPGAKQTTLRYAWGQSPAQYAEWAKHMNARGWMSRTYDYTCDEPPSGCAFSDINAKAQTVHGADPSFSTLVTTDLGHAMQNNVASAIDIMVPNEVILWPRGGSDTRPSYDSWLTTGKRLFFYQSCNAHGTCANGTPSNDHGWPTVMIDVPAEQNRAFEWESFLERMQGELYYNTVGAYVQGNDPWQNQYFFGGNGDGTLFYPGTPNRIGGTDPVPVASIRLKLIRAGLQDYEYLKILSDLGGGADAMKIAAEVIPGPGVVADANTLLQARDQIASEIVARVPQGTTYTPPNSGGSTGTGNTGGNTGTGTPTPSGPSTPSAAADPTASAGGCNVAGGHGKSGASPFLVVAAVLAWLIKRRFTTRRRHRS